MKVWLDGHLACKVFVYIDDGRIMGWCKWECWHAARTFCLACVWLGIKDACWKRTMPSAKPGPWAGTVVYTAGEVKLTGTQLKWDKTKALIAELEDMMTRGLLPRNRLEQIWRFLIYVARMYGWVTPYRKERPGPHHQLMEDGAQCRGLEAVTKTTQGPLHCGVGGRRVLDLPTEAEDPEDPWGPQW